MIKLFFLVFTLVFTQIGFSQSIQEIGGLWNVKSCNSDTIVLYRFSDTSEVNIKGAVDVSVMSVKKQLGNVFFIDSAYFPVGQNSDWLHWRVGYSAKFKYKNEVLSLKREAYRETKFWGFLEKKMRYKLILNEPNLTLIKLE